MRAQLAMSPGLSASVTKVMALSDSVFRKRYRSFYETPSPYTPLPVRKRYRGTSELILDTNSEGDELGDKDTNEDGDDKSLDLDDKREERTAMTFRALWRPVLALEAWAGHVDTQMTARVTMRAQLAMSPGLSASVTEAMALSDLVFRKSEGDELGDKDTDEDGDDKSLDSDDKRERYRFRSLEREQERTAMTFRALWRPVLALEAWAGHVDTR
nr:hypothetical protein [Tanacetum cinerariifolium]